MMSPIMYDEFEEWRPEDTSGEQWETGANWSPGMSRKFENSFPGQLNNAHTVPEMMQVARNRLEQVLEHDPDGILDENDLDSLLYFICQISGYSSPEDLRSVLEGVIAWEFSDLERYAREVRRHMTLSDGTTEGALQHAEEEARNRDQC